ncbi:MAG: tetratricopeptide repeat protein [Thermoguttaceae bacterium]
MSHGQHIPDPLTIATPARRWPVWLVCTLLCLAIGLIYGKTLGHTFVCLDDHVCVSGNPLVTNGLTIRNAAWALSHRYAGVWAPTVWISHTLDWTLYGPWAGGHHLTNVLLHAVTTLLLFFALQRMTGRLWPSALAAALFAVHPLRVESVAWVTERKDMLSGLFFTLTLWAYARYVRKGALAFAVGQQAVPPGGRYRPYLLVVTLFAFGLMSKPTIVTLPLVLLLLDYWPLGRLAREPEPGANRSAWPDVRQLVAEKLPLLALAAAASIVAIWAQQVALDINVRFSLGWRLAHVPVAYVGYLGQFFWPMNLAVPYPRPAHLPAWHVAGALALLLLISAATIAARRRFPYLLVGWLWYLIMLLPAVGLLQFGVQATADRFTYLPQIGLAIAVAWGLSDLGGATRAAPRRWMVGSVAVVTLIASTAVAWRQTSCWRNSETLMNRALQCTTDNTLAHLWLAGEYAMQNRAGEALQHCTAALAMDPNRGEVLDRVGLVQDQLGLTDDAIAQYRKAIRVEPDYPDAHFHLATVLARRKQWNEALPHYADAVRLRPSQDEWHFHFGDALAHVGRLDEAIQQYSQALSMDPDWAEAHNNLGMALVDRGQLAEAAQHYLAAVQLAPNYFEARYNLGLVLHAMGQLGEAVVQYRAALKLNPDDADAHNNLGLALAAAGKPNDAVVEYGRALECKPDCVEALGNLAAAYARAGRVAEAIAATRRAIDLAVRNKNMPLAAALRSRLAEYEAAKPSR